MSVQFLTLDEVLAFHERLIERFGGSYGVRDLGLLESALYRPRSGYYDDILTMAAALFESLVMNHAFVDGNKRIAFFAADVFLRMNGWKIEVAPREAHAFICDGLATSSLDRDAIEGWLRQSVRPLG